MGSKEKIKLGSKVRDVISGFMGIAAARAEYLHNQDSIGIRGTELKDGKPLETVFMDSTYIEFIEDTDIPVPDFPTPTVELGDTIEDTISGCKGVAIGRAYWLSGCIRIGIQPQGLTKEGQAIDEQWFPMSQVKVLKKTKEKRKELPLVVR
jgi:hypothetical protein